MPIPLRLNTATGNLTRFQTGEELLVDKLDRLSGSGHLIIGDSLGAGEEIKLGTATSDVRVLGDLIVDGSETVSTNETVTGTFTANGDVNLGSNDGDAVSLGGGTSDTVTLKSDLTLGNGVVGIGSGATDYATDLWLAAVNDNGPDADAYNLSTSGTNCGAYAIGIDPTLLANVTATDLMTALDQIDAAIGSAGGETLQETYALGNTIAVTSGNGTVQMTNDTASDTTDVLTLGKAPGSSTGGNVLTATTGANATGVLAFLNNAGSGNALQVQDGGSDVFVVNGAGAVAVTPTSGQGFSVTALGAGTIGLSAAAAVSISSSGAGVAISGAAASSLSTSAGNLSLDAAAAELVLDDVGNSGATLSQSADRTFDQTGTGEVLNGATSLIGAINRLARRIDVDGPVTELPIENGVTLSAGDVVGQSSTAGRCTQANGNAATNVKVIGICIVGGTGDAGGTVSARVALPGSKVTDSGASYTAANALFVPDGTGRAVETAPSDTGDLVMRVGWALSATSFIIDLGPGVVL